MKSASVSLPIALIASTVSAQSSLWATFNPKDLCSTTTTVLALATPFPNPDEATSSLDKKYIAGEITGAITTAGELVNVASTTYTNGWGEPATGYWVAFESHLRSEGLEIKTAVETWTSVCTHSLAPSPTGRGKCTPHQDHWHCDNAPPATGTATPSLPPSPTASANCHPHIDHWHCEGPATKASGAASVTGTASATGAASETSTVTGAAPVNAVSSLMLGGIALAAAAFA